MRMAALMKQRNIQVYTRLYRSGRRRSDPPTHRANCQPARHAEHVALAPLRCGRIRHRLESAIERKDGPVSVGLSRQNLPHQNRSEQLADAAKGGLCAASFETGEQHAILIATGSEVPCHGCCRKARNQRQERIRCLHAKRGFLPQAIRCLSGICTACCRAQARCRGNRPCRLLVSRFVGLDGAVVGMTTFGESAPGDVLMKQFGFTVDNVVATVQGLFA